MLLLIFRIFSAFCYRSLLWILKNQNPLTTAQWERTYENSDKEKGWTQDFLSEQCGITSTNLSHIERGKTKPSVKTLVKIANCLEVNLDSLLCDSLTSAATPIFMNKISATLESYSDLEIRILYDVLDIMKVMIQKHNT